MSDETIDYLETFWCELLAMVARGATPYVNVATACELVKHEMTLAISQPGLTSEAAAAIVGRSEAQLKRDRRPYEPDQFSVLYALNSLLAPLRPEGLEPRRICFELNQHFERLSLPRLVEILEFYRMRGCLHRDEEGRYSWNAAAFLHDEGRIHRRTRVRRYAPELINGLFGYLSGRSGTSLHVLQVESTHEEFGQFMGELEQFVRSYWEHHPPKKDDARFQVQFVAQRGDSTGSASAPVPGADPWSSLPFPALSAPAPVRSPSSGFAPGPPASAASAASAPSVGEQQEDPAPRRTSPGRSPAKTDPHPDD